MGKNVVSIGTELATGKKKFYNNPRMASAPFLSILEDVMSNFRRIKTKDGWNAQAILKMGTDLTLFGAHVPMQVSRDIGYLMNVASGKVRPTGPVDFIRGAVTGTASPKSK